MEREERAREILRLLKKLYPKPETALKFGTPFELLVAAVLSAQSTDAQVNRVTPGLFKKYPSVKDFADAPLEQLERGLSSVNFYRNKARNIQCSARTIIERHSAEVPKTMEGLTALPGVARKTANIILSVAYGIIEGIAVDTHVKRLAGRLGLTVEHDPVKIERDLMALTPKEEWADLSQMLILHGRNTCRAKGPMHDECVLYDICPSREA